MQLHPGLTHCSAPAITWPQPALKRLSRALVEHPPTHGPHGPLITSIKRDLLYSLGMRVSLVFYVIDSALYRYYNNCTSYPPPHICFIGTC